MNNIVLSDVATAVPPLVLMQKEIEGYFFHHLNLTPQAKNLYKRFLNDPGIEKRAVAADFPEEVFNKDLDAIHQRFSRWSVLLAKESVNKLLKQNSLKPSDIDGIVIATCTGYLCPGLSSYIVEHCQLSPSVQTLDLVGLGCGAALPAFRSAHDMLLNPATKRVIVVCVEICTATAVWENTVDLILSNSIFSDGAAACLFEKDGGKEGISFDKFLSLTLPEYREGLRYHTRQGRLVNTLSPDVASIVSQAVYSLHSELSEEKNFDNYAFHTGGRKILDEIAKKLSLSEKDMTASRKVLKEYGNMSSPCLMFALLNLMNKPSESKKGNIGLFSFGAGVTAFGAQARWVNQENHKESLHEQYSRPNQERTYSIA